MLGIILVALFGCGRVNPMILNSTISNFTISTPISTQTQLEWWRTLPRALIPNGPLTLTDLPTVLLVDQHPPPTIQPPQLTGREGAQILLYQNPFTTWADPSLASKCGAQWSADSSKYIQSGRITRYATGQPALYAKEWIFTPKPPCCGQCSIDGMSAELRYWPTPAPTPSVTTIVDESGFTYVSPSVYVVFKSLGAYDACSHVGRVYRSQTFSFASDELSTSRAVHDFNGILHYPFDYSWTAFNYAEITNSSCTEVAAYSIEEDHYTNTKGETITADANTFYYNPCFPFLSLPTQVLSLDPAWSTCVHGLGAFYDPPRVLKSVSDLLAPVQASTTMGSHDPVPTGEATAGQAIVLPPMATPTITPSVPSPTTPADPKPPDSRPENVQSQNSQPDPILNLAPDPQVPPIPTNSPTKSIPEPLPIVDPKPPPDSPEGIPNTENNPGNGDGIQAPRPVAPSIYVSGEKVVEGATPTTIGGKVIAYISGSLHVGDKIQPVPTAVPQADPGTSLNVDGLHVEIKAPSPPGKPEDDTQAPTPVAPIIYVSGEKVAEGAMPTTIGGKVIVYTSGSLHVGDKIQYVPMAIPQTYPGKSLNVDGLHIEIQAPPPPGKPYDDTQAPTPVAPVIYVSGEKVAEGATPTTIGGKVIVYNSGSLLVGDKIQPVPTAIPQTYPGTSLNVDGLHIEIQAPTPPGKPYDDTQVPTPVAPVIYVFGEKVVEGATPTTIGGKVVVYTSGSLHVGDKIQPVPTAIPQTYPGTSINLEGLDVEIKAPSPLSKPDNANPQTPLITSGPLSFVAQQNYHVVLNGQTIIAGGSAQTISGTRISLATSGTAIIVGEHTIQIPNGSNLPPNATPTITLALGSSTYTIPLSSNLVISPSNNQLAATPRPFIVLQGQTLLAGGEAKTISGTVVSLAPSATALLVAGTLIPISKSAPDAPAAAVVLNLGSSRYTATLSTDSLISSGVAQTLFPGSVVTVGGRPISLDASGGGEQGLGGVILGEFHNNNPGSAHDSTPVAVVLVGTQKQTITPTPVLVGGRTVYIYPSGAVLISGGGTVINTGSGSPFPRVTTGANSSTSRVDFFTGGTSSLKLTTFCGLVYWERIISMALAISLSVIIAY